MTKTRIDDLPGVGGRGATQDKVAAIHQLWEQEGRAISRGIDPAAVQIASARQIHSVVEPETTGVDTAELA